MAFKYKEGTPVTVTLSFTPRAGSVNYGKTIPSTSVVSTMVASAPNPSKFTLSNENFSDWAGNTDFNRLIANDSALTNVDVWVPGAGVLSEGRWQAWIQYDFQSSITLTSFNIGASRPLFESIGAPLYTFVNTYELWKSDNNENWTKMGEYTNGGDNVSGHWHPCTVPNKGGARYWRIYCLTSCNGATRGDIGGLQFFGY